MCVSESHGTASQSGVIKRRGLSALALALTAAPAMGQEAWPARPVRLIIPFAPGGPIDTVGRLIGERLRDRLGQPLVIDNRAGAGGSIGLRAAVQAPPDGYTLVLTSSSMAILPAIYANLGFDPRTDLTPVSLVAEIATTIVVRANHRFTNLQAMLDEARAKPGSITYGTSGIGSSNHLSGAMLAAVARIDITMSRIAAPHRRRMLSMPATSTSSSRARWKHCRRRGTAAQESLPSPRQHAFPPWPMCLPRSRSYPATSPRTGSPWRRRRACRNRS